MAVDNKYFYGANFSEAAGEEHPLSSVFSIPFTGYYLL
jgi:hypothetical protein